MILPTNLTIIETMKESAFQAHRVNELRALKDSVIVTDMIFSERLTTGGILLLNDDTKLSGIRPRWCKIYAVGPEQEHLKVGEYILVSHGRWTRGIKIEDDSGERTIRKVDIKDILMVSDEPVEDQTMSDKVY